MTTLRAPALDQLNLTRKSCYLLSDNINSLYYGNRRQIQDYITILNGHVFLKNSCINKPKRIFNQSASLSDHIWSDNYNVNNVSDILITDVAEHYTLFLTSQQNIDYPQQESVTDRNYKGHEY